MSFRLANRGGRAVLVLDNGILDLESATNGAFDADPMHALERGDELARVGDRLAGAAPDVGFDPIELGPCVPRPAQVFGVGLNYRSHAAESGMELPTIPM